MWVGGRRTPCKSADAHTAGHPKAPIHTPTAITSFLDVDDLAEGSESPAISKAEPDTEMLAKAVLELARHLTEEEYRRDKSKRP